MGTKVLRIFVALVCFMVISVPLPAHHGSAGYDMDKELVMKGTVTEWVWSNPHVQIYFDVKNNDGSVEHWACETNSPGRLSRSGWKKDMVKPGDPITITLFRSKKGAAVGLLEKLELANGKEFAGQPRTKEETQ